MTIKTLSHKYRQYRSYRPKAVVARNLRVCPIFKKEWIKYPIKDKNRKSGGLWAKVVLIIKL
jgi:hypothetical protein